jgi:nicotinamide riboside transporter PnuC
MVEIIDLISLLLVVPGLWLLGNKNKKAFVLFVLSNFTVGYVAIVKSLPGLLIMQLVFLLFNIRNYILWRNDEANVP